MSDLISRNALLDALNKKLQSWCGYENADFRLGIYNCIEIVEMLPSEDRPTGHIVTKCSGKLNHTVWAECSECGKPIDSWDKFCRYCGAKMFKGGEEDET